MENVHREAEQQVWQRVLAQSGEQPRNDLRQLQMEAMELSGIYRQLMASASGVRRERLKQLLEGEQQNAACLRGVALLSGRWEEILKVWNPAKESQRKLLEKCYHKTRRCMVEYMGRSAEPEFGVVFRQLADREGRHCGWIAELLGTGGM